MQSFFEVSRELGYDPYALLEKQCVHCGTNFVTNIERRKFCSSKCRTANHRLDDTNKNTDKPPAFCSTTHQRMRREIINEYKVRCGCADCGFNKHPAALDFDHKDPSQKLFLVSGDPKRNWKEMAKEIEKCEVVCANCHRIRTDEKNHYRTARRSPMGNPGARGTKTSH